VSLRLKARVMAWQAALSLPAVSLAGRGERGRKCGVLDENDTMREGKAGIGRSVCSGGLRSIAPN